MKRTAWLTIILAATIVWPASSTRAGLWQQLLRWAGAGWGDGYHAQTNTTGYAPLPGTWKHRPPHAACGTAGCLSCPSTAIGPTVFGESETVETIVPQRGESLKRLPPIPAESSPNKPGVPTPEVPTPPGQPVAPADVL